MAKNYTLTKSKVRETIVKAFGEDLNKTIKLGEVLELFAPAHKGGNRKSTKNVLNDKGEIIARQCSVLGVYLPISEFNRAGKDSYASASKIGIKLVREREAQIKELEEKLINAQDINEIKKLQKEIKELRNKPYTVSANIKYAKTAEEAAKIFS